MTPRATAVPAHRRPSPVPAGRARPAGPRRARQPALDPRPAPARRRGHRARVQAARAGRSSCATATARELPARARARGHLGRRAPRPGRARLPARGLLRGRARAHRRRPLPLPAHPRRDRPAPDQRGPARAAVGGARRAGAPLRQPRSATGSAAPRSRSGRRRPAASGSRATSTAGTAASTRCASSGSPGSGSCSSRASAPAPATSTSILGADGQWREKADPMAFCAEPPPDTASKVFESQLHVGRPGLDGQPGRPSSTSTSRCRSTRCTWRRGAAARAGSELADELPAYVADLGFTHVELMPVMQHPFGGSWGYHVTSYFAPDSRFGDPDGFRLLVDRLHQAGIGVILDWVPGPLRDRRVGAGEVRRHAALRGPQPAARLAQGVGLAHLQLRPPRGAQLPLRQRALLARGVPRRRAAGRRRRVDALPRLLARGGRVDAEQVRRPREPRGGAVPPGDERHRLQAGARRRPRSPRSRPPGRRSPGPTSVGRAGLRLQVEHGLDARHARLPRSATRCTAPTTTAR